VQHGLSVTGYTLIPPEGPFHFPGKRNLGQQIAIAHTSFTDNIQYTG